MTDADTHGGDHSVGHHVIATVRCAEAQSMPEGPAGRGVEATRARARASARHAESIDGAEPSGSIELVMAGWTPHHRVTIPERCQIDGGAARDILLRSRKLGDAVCPR